MANLISGVARTIRAVGSGLVRELLLRLDCLLSQ
jgi:hypothetical protein